LKILVFGSSGRLGRKILEYGLQEGHEMFGFVRNPARLTFQHPQLQLIQGDAEDPEAIENAIPGKDLIISCLGVNNLKPPITLMSDAVLFMLDAMVRFQVPRILAVGGAGILQETPDRFKMESPGFPPFFKAISEDYLRVYELLKASDREWTMVCPPTMPERVRTGQYRVLGDYFPEAGQQIFVEDVADFILKEIPARQFIRQRVGIAY
jgi:putative NADH-flavin reductase